MQTQHDVETTVEGASTINHDSNGVPAGTVSDSNITSNDAYILGDTMASKASSLMDRCESCLLLIPRRVEAIVEFAADASTNEVYDIGVIPVMSSCFVTKNSDKLREGTDAITKASNLIKLCDICDFCQQLEKCHLREVGYFRTESAVHPIKKLITLCDCVNEESLDTTNPIIGEGSVKWSDDDQVQLETSYNLALGQDVDNDWDALYSDLRSNSVIVEDFFTTFEHETYELTGDADSNGIPSQTKLTISIEGAAVSYENVVGGEHKGSISTVRKSCGCFELFGDCDRSSLPSPWSAWIN